MIDFFCSLNFRRTVLESCWTDFEIVGCFRNFETFSATSVDKIVSTTSSEVRLSGKMFVAGPILRSLQIFGFSKSVLLQSFYHWTGPQNSFQHGSDQQKLRSLVWSFLNIQNFWNRSNSDEDTANTVPKVCAYVYNYDNFHTAGWAPL